MPRTVAAPLTGWGNLPSETCRQLRPERRRELFEAMALPAVLPRGLGRSYGDAAVNAGGTVVLQERLDRMLAFDEAEGMLRCEGGVSLDAIERAFLPHGRFPAVVPGTRFVTVGGAIAADAHGKNHHRVGSFASSVRSLLLLTPQGELRPCSRDRDPELFWATFGGMGLTGVVVEATLELRRVETAFVSMDTRRCGSLAELLHAFEQVDAESEHTVAWIDCLAGGRRLGRSVLMRGRHAALDELPPRLRRRPLAPRRGLRLSVPAHPPAWLLGPLTMRAFNELYHRAHRDRAGSLRHLEAFHHPLDAVAGWNRLYGRRGFLQFQAVLPPAAAAEGIAAMLRRSAEVGTASFLAVLKRFGPANAGPLSFPMEGCTLAMDLANSEASRRLVETLNGMAAEAGGRVYLAKDALLRRTEFEAMYPRHGEFRAVRERIDPQGRLTSSLARRIGLA